MQAAEEEPDDHGSQQSGFRLHQSGIPVLHIPARHLGALLYQPRLLPHLPQPNLRPLRLRGRRRPLPHGLLELGHLHHDLARRLQDALLEHLPEIWRKLRWCVAC